jgi:dTDP-4-dehydrorhamnose 3,5-epimerase
MLFEDLRLAGAFRISLQKVEDERGFFARSWCHDEFTAHGLNASLAQSNISFNKVKGTLRGMHFQAAPHAEAKLMRCTYGSIYDVMVDMRPESPTYLQWFGAELTQDNREMLYVPEGFAHGFQTLTDNTEVTYHVTEFYTPGAEGGVRYNDPAIGIAWPLPVDVISAKDANWPLLEAAAEAGRAR